MFLVGMYGADLRMGKGLGLRVWGLGFPKITGPLDPQPLRNPYNKDSPKKDPEFMKTSN